MDKKIYDSSVVQYSLLSNDTCLAHPVLYIGLAIHPDGIWPFQNGKSSSWVVILLKWKTDATKNSIKWQSDTFSIWLKISSQRSERYLRQITLIKMHQDPRDIGWCWQSKPVAIDKHAIFPKENLCGSELIYLNLRRDMRIYTVRISKSPFTCCYWREGKKGVKDKSKRA